MEKLSTFKYKRHCSIFKSDLEKDDRESKALLVKNHDKDTSKKEALNGKINSSSTVKEAAFYSVKNHAAKNLKKNCDKNTSKTPALNGKSNGRSTTNKTTTFNGEKDDAMNLEKNCGSKQPTLNGEDSGCSMAIKSAIFHSKKDHVKNVEKNCKNETGLDETSFDKDVADFRLDILKEVCKDSYSNGDVLNAVENCDNLEQAVSRLLESPMKNGDGDQYSEDTTTCEAGPSNLNCGNSRQSKKHKRSLSDDFSDCELSNFGTPSKQRKLSNNTDTRTMKHSSESSIIDFEVEEGIKKLMELFPDSEEKELRNVLESCGGCLEQAIGTMVAFTSPKKKNSHDDKLEEAEVVDVFVIEDDGDDNGEDDGDDDRDEDVVIVKQKASTAARKPRRIVLVSDDDDSENDSDESCDDDTNLSKREKTEVLSMLDCSEVAELSLVPTCSLKKAKTICSLRPFENWNNVIQKFNSTTGLHERLLLQFYNFIDERNKMSDLLDQCEIIARDICDLFVTEEVDTEDGQARGAISKSSLVTKKQYVTKEPSNVASGFTLKSYQLTGLNWLIALHKKKVNGILADEMGLGKTIQAIVFLAHLIEKGERGPHLIVVPSSTVDNWKRELDNWCPSVTYVHYQGSQNERRDIRDEILSESVHQFEIVLTTYNMAISSVPDRVFLKKLQFHYAIYDEGHMLKNMKSQRYQALLRIRPRRMLLLTGTPIQNNLMELMSLLMFIMPNMFQERSEGIKMIFGENKLKRKEGSTFEKEKVVQAKKIMEPFVLRRIKKDVLGHLPAKYDHFIECDLPSRQRKVYNDTFASCYKMLSSGDAKAIGGGGIALCMQLRKAANHATLLRDFYTDEKLSEMARKYCKDPRHRDSDPNLVFEDMQVMSDFELTRLCLEEKNLKKFEMPNELIMECGKYAYLDSVLPDMKKKGDRVLLFNQFTMMMDITEVYLQTRKYKYLRLDGSTLVSERQTLIDRYNTEEDIFVFLLSTKAGGLGINLTSANVVIMYDSDYNPHNDKQAEDRCHRMGQIREVNVYRLVCKDTVEQTILKCASDKIRLHQDMSEKQKPEDELETKDVQTLIQAVFGLQ